MLLYKFCFGTEVRREMVGAESVWHGVGDSTRTGNVEEMRAETR